MSTQAPQAAATLSMAIPTTIRIGVTGHREIESEMQVRERVRDVLRQLDEHLKNTPHSFVAVSPLAEGADRLVAAEVLSWHSASAGTGCLEVILPLAAEDYAEDFTTPESRAAFRALLARASTVQTLPPSVSRQHAYAAVGRSVVRQCDVLIAVWNGESASGLGGTGEVVKYARQQSRTLFWINSRNGELVPERHADRIHEMWAHLDALNAEPLDVHSLAEGIQAAENQFAEQAADAGLEPRELLAAVQGRVPHFVRIDQLAQRYRNRYAGAGTAVYVLAAAAAAIVAVQNLILPEMPAVLWLEVLLMAAILGILVTSRRGEWHRKYVDYRFIAERLRTALYLSVAGVLDLARPAGDMSKRDDSDWAARAVAATLSTSPRHNASEAPLGLLKPLLLQAWILDQADWFEQKGEGHRRRHEQLARAGEVVFAATLIAAAIQAAGWFEAMTTNSSWPRVLTALTLGLPAVGAALAGLRSHREYLQTSERYRAMTRALRARAEQVEQALTPEQLTGLLRDVEVILREENQDWRTVIRLHELEPP